MQLFVAFLENMNFMYYVRIGMSQYGNHLLV